MTKQVSPKIHCSFPETFTAFFADDSLNFLILTVDVLFVWSLLSFSRNQLLTSTDWKISGCGPFVTSYLPFLLFYSQSLSTPSSDEGRNFAISWKRYLFLSHLIHKVIYFVLSHLLCYLSARSSSKLVSLS